MARTKQVFSTDEVYHLWANQTQNSARNPGGNVSFDGVLAKSYSAIIGVIAKNAAGETAYLYGTRSYSVTTAKHQAMILRAIPRGAVSFAVYETGPQGWGTYNPNPVKLLEGILAELPALAAAAKNARSNKDYKTAQYINRVDDAVKFAGFFGLPVPVIIGIEEQAEAVKNARAIVLKQEREDAARADKKAREHLADWLVGGPAWGLQGLKMAYMRLASDGETLETTHGARVPAEHVKKGAKLVQMLVNRAIETKHSVIPTRDLRFGYYKLTSISAAGIVTVGCHQFDAGEITRVAGLLGEAA